MTDIKELAALASQLNAKTDGLNISLQKAQDKINSLGIGIEVWLRTSLHESDYTDVLDRDSEPTGQREFYADELGYGRHGESWALLTRTRRFVTTPNVDELDAFDETGPKPLLQAARKLRIAAVDQIPNLVEALKQAATEALAAIERAKKIADDIE